ncbi:unnamed protein product [Parascedosporium putredinis]|uniref:DUF7600 domain-containing protein n=1 Tax=Parascedosporium putredinis TaxID=1442378 RepID=A0A9P1H2Y6_9PEZI|nr:unnamed protein product [Parascedosporium putredinis]CAI7994057.1 unnamed protein product [Parascedosporium putredinis]
MAFANQEKCLVCTLHISKFPRSETWQTRLRNLSPGVDGASLTDASDLENTQANSPPPSSASSSPRPAGEQTASPSALPGRGQQRHPPWAKRESVLQPSSVIAVRDVDMGPFDVPGIRHALDTAPAYPAFMICEAVAAHLSTPDFLTLRLASRAFWPIFHGQQFWAVKFRLHGERGWVMEAKERARAALTPPDWRWMWHATRGCQCPWGCQSAIHLTTHKQRLSTWRCIRSLCDLLSLRWHTPAASDPQALEAAESDTRPWLRVAGRLDEESSPPNRPIEEGCRILQKRYFTVPGGIKRVAVSHVRIGHASYIAGIRLIAADEELAFGWHSDNPVVVRVAGVVGFNFAADLRGFRAIQVVSRDGGTSRWMGDLEGMAVTTRLGRGEEELAAVEVGFDGLKIVSLAVPNTTAERTTTLKDNAFWFPDVPSPHLDLNDASYPQLEHTNSSFQPLQRFRFGGPGGIFLRSLTAVHVHCVSNRPRTIEFQYDSPSIHPERLRLGPAAGAGSKASLAIDGPGERS